MFPVCDVIVCFFSVWWVVTLVHCSIPCKDRKTTWHQRGSKGCLCKSSLIFSGFDFSHYCCAHSLARLSFELSFYVFGTVFGAPRRSPATLLYSFG